MTRGGDAVSAELVGPLHLHTRATPLNVSNKVGCCNLTTILSAGFQRLKATLDINCF